VTSDRDRFDYLLSGVNYLTVARLDETHFVTSAERFRDTYGVPKIGGVFETGRGRVEIQFYETRDCLLLLEVRRIEEAANGE
jgi:hypothetical protein